MDSSCQDGETRSQEKWRKANQCTQLLIDRNRILWSVKQGDFDIVNELDIYVRVRRKDLGYFHLNDNCLFEERDRKARNKHKISQGTPYICCFLFML